MVAWFLCPLRISRYGGRWILDARGGVIPTESSIYGLRMKGEALRAHSSCESLEFVIGV